MMLFYVDETGNCDPRLRIRTRTGDVIDGDPLYVTTAVSVFAQRWHTFEKTINRHKSALIKSVFENSGDKLDLADCEIKSNWLRQPNERAKHKLLRHLSDSEILALVDLHYDQVFACKMHILSVVIDKRHMPEATTQNDIRRMAWNRLLDLIERLMRARHRKHQAIIINDDVTQQENRRLAMLHASLMDQGTRDGTWLRHICEMPMFVRSELSVGVQIADLCSYNIYRALKSEDLEYPYFKRIAPAIWKRGSGSQERFSGIWVIGDGSPVYPLARSLNAQK